MARSKTTKRALVASVCATLMCIAMLIGTTFAWFTDTASTSVNKIQSGTLDVELYYANNTTGGDGTEWTKITSETTALNFVKASAASEGEAVLWEPGCTYSLPALKIKNEGNLALKYKVLFNAVDTSDEDLELAKVLDVTMNGQPAGTLYDVLTSTDEDGYAHGTLEGNAETSAITLSVKMRETAGNEYQNLTIGGIAVTVVATQDTVEYDSSNNTYDTNATYPEVVADATAIQSALASESSSSVILADNITVADKKDLQITSSDKSIDFNGKTLSGSLSSGSTSASDPAVNLVLSDPNNNGAEYSIDSSLNRIDGGGMTQIAAVSAWKPTVTIESGRYTHNNMVICNQLQTSDADAVGVVVNGGTFDGKANAAVVANVIGTVEINNGTFNAKDSDDDFGACVYLSYGNESVPTITNIHGGTFTAGKVLFYVVEGSSNYTQKINITGGTFNVGESGELIKLSGSGTATSYLVITGGTFNVDPSAYVDTSKYNVTNDTSAGTWTVTAK